MESITLVVLGRRVYVLVLWLQFLSDSRLPRLSAELAYSITCGVGLNHFPA